MDPNTLAIVVGALLAILFLAGYSTHIIIEDSHKQPTRWRNGENLSAMYKCYPIKENATCN